MTTASFNEFQTRLKRIKKTHLRLADGAQLHMDKSGLVTAQPRTRLVFPWRVVLHLVVGALLLKAALLAGLGPAAYAETLQSLATGTTPERVGAFIMQADPVTELLAAGLGKIF
ncbi:hypothetical protein ACXN5S_12365 [Pseudoroseicyclus sp. H15]